MHIFVNKRRILKNPYQQNFSIPSNIIYYITKFPSSSKGYQKLLKTCAYFYSGNHIVVFDWLRFVSEEWRFTPFKSIPCNIEKCSFKLWLNNFLFVKGGDNYNSLGALLPKLYRCELKALTIVNQNITFKEYKILIESRTINHICFNNFVVHRDDGNAILTFDQLIKYFPALQHLNCKFVNNPHLHVTSETALKMTKLKKFWYLTHFTISGVPDSINLTDFCSFIMKNPASYSVNFFSTVSQEFKNEFKQMLKINSLVYEDSASIIPAINIYLPK